MSYQHFYSRVPARVSFFNKRDGFDTFAFSSALGRELILGELAHVYYDKLNLHDPIKVRRGEVPVVYSQMPLSSGNIVQTAITYLPTDFTGERSAYLAHSLVLTNEEMDRVIHSSSVDVFNRDMFITDVTAFRLTDRNAAPNPACPESSYVPNPIFNHRTRISAFNPEMLKSFIQSVVSVACEGGRSVYFRLPVADAQASAAAVDFLNAIISLLPFELRDRLSFVSYVNTPDAYPGFMLKGVGSSFVGVNPEVGVFYDFSTGVVTGKPAGAERGLPLSSFLYSLFEYGKIREAFQLFVRGILSKYEGLTLDVKTLKDITFLFWQCSGFYVENTVLPDDESISRLFDIYEQYRDGLSTEHRVQAYKCLSRYSDAQIAIPDSVFSRISKLYPDECVEAKAVALDVLLKLIHVDLMRDSLFCFISRNYPRETNEVKAVVVANLARVFYGGFLQNNILAFFDMIFRREPVNTRDIILDKLLLSIRTPEIQSQIVVFLDRHYAALNPTQKLRICNTCLEMLPECDGLSALLVGLINRRIGRDSADISALMENKLTEMLGAFLVAGDGRLAAIFVDNPGFCEDVAIKYALNQRQGVELIIGILAAMPGHKRADKLTRAYAVAEEIDRNLYPSLLYRFGGVMVAVWPSTLSEMLERDAAAEKALSADMIELYRQVVIYPAILFTMYQVFSTDQGSVGLDAVVDYAAKNPYVAQSAEYKTLTDYLELVRAAGLGDIESAFKHAFAFPESEELRAAIAEYIKATAYKPDTQDGETAICYELLINYLRGGSFGFDEMYPRYQKQFEDARIDEGGLFNLRPDRKGAVDAVELILSAASEICDAEDELCEMIVEDGSGLSAALKSFIGFYGLGIGAGTILKKLVKDASLDLEELVNETIEDCK